jgi:hypothetical protein
MRVEMSAMTVKPEQVGGKGKSARRAFFAGFLFGVLASFLVLVVVVFKYGPRGESTEVDLYSGRTMTHRFFLWKRSHTPGPEFPHVRWAIGHQNPVRNWYVFVCSTSRGWFEKGMAVDTFRRNYVYAIYSLQIPEEEKVKLLHQYHEEVDALKSKQQEYYESGRFMERFDEDWAQKVKEAAKEG